MATYMLVLANSFFSTIGRSLRSLQNKSDRIILVLFFFPITHLDINSQHFFTDLGSIYALNHDKKIVKLNGFL